MKTNKWNSIVGDDFNVPESLETKDFRLRKLTVEDTEKDYEAVMNSIDWIKGVFGDLMPDWPSNDLTKEEDMSNLGWHQTEFSMRTSFAYTVESLDKKRCLGCVYIFPSRNKNYEVEVYMWIRESDKKLDLTLFAEVKKWLEDKWPFKKIKYPGRM